MPTSCRWPAPLQRERARKKEREREERERENKQTSSSECTRAMTHTHNTHVAGTGIQQFPPSAPKLQGRDPVDRGGKAGNRGAFQGASHSSRTGASFHESRAGKRHGSVCRCVGAGVGGWCGVVWLVASHINCPKAWRHLATPHTMHHDVT